LTAARRDAGGTDGKVAMTAPTPAPATPEPTTPPAGATPPATTPTPEPPKPDDKPLGPAGEKALREEREARKALEKQVADLAPLKRIAEALGAGKPEAAGKSEVELLSERFAQHERALAEERAARHRAEVAHEKGLTPAQAARLQGGTREELLADADALIALFPAATTATPGTPKPDLSQGARGAGPDIDALIRDAESKGNVREAIRLKNQKLHTTR
jgi:hypothetical protein